MDIERVEQKYLITEPEAARRIAKLSAVMDRDEHDDGTGYTIRSLYFDTPFDKDFYDKLDGLANRRKIRIRTYAATPGFIRLELKEKSTTFQRKQAIALSEEEARNLMAGDYGILLEREEPLAKELYGMMMKFAYRPKVIVEYDRIAFAGDCNEIRITFDEHIRTCETDLDLFKKDLPFLPAVAPSEVTMEVKYNGFLLSHIKECISLADELPVSASKYCMGRVLF